MGTGKEEYYMGNWKPQEDVGVVFDDQTAEPHSVETMNQMIEDLRDIANKYGFDLNMWNHGHFIGFKKTNELAKQLKENNDSTREN